MKQKDIITVLILTFIVIVAWIVLNILHAKNASTISEELNQQIVPIEASFDTHTIDLLKQRDQIDPLYGPLASSSAQTVQQISPAVQVQSPQASSPGVISR